MHNIPFVPGGIDNLSRDSRSISRDVSVLYIPKVGNSPRTKCKQIIALKLAKINASQ